MRIKINNILRIREIYLKIIGLFEKNYPIYYYDLYIPVSLYNVILKNENEVNKKNIITFFSKEPFSIKKKNIHISKQADKLFYLSIGFYDEEKMKLFKDEIKKYSELFPFWIVFPNNFYGAPHWNQGYQEQYRDVFLKYWNSLDKDDQQEYMNKYKCPLEWRDWLNEYENYK